MKKLFIARRVLGEGVLGYVEEIHIDRPVEDRYEFCGDQAAAMKMTEAQCQRFGDDVAALGSVAFSMPLDSPNEQWIAISPGAPQT
ncbi:hypothetical protein J2W30_003713 [Variovorax boronicumulans]|uniref:hypothetical protein n=1 Tax=Variovorax boronicumulans TaxID=436515 RepID=UPI00277E216D|nr:hypothetical protein [Variovorax boronicumulans]MDQ0035940.1 hypothetical protein [Variovorax boronicumulans]